MHIANRWTFAASLLVLLSLAVPAAVAQPVIDVGTLEIYAAEGQEVLIMVTGGQAVQGMNFFAQIANGATGPTFMQADILNGTIFDGNNLGVFGGGYVDLRWLYQGVVTSSGTVAADGVLATLTLDSRGLLGSYALSMTNQFEDAETDFAGVSANVTDGLLNVVGYPGDATLDGEVGAGDLGILARNFGGSGGWTEGDFNGSGDVGAPDLGTLARNFGANINVGANAVPAPGGLAVVLTGGLAVLRRRRR